MALDNPITIDGVEIDDIEEDGEIETSRDYRLDFEKGRILGMVDGVDAVIQSVRKIILTERFKCLIYSDQYGSEIKDDILADDVTPEYIMASAPTKLEEALSVDERITGISDIEITFPPEKDGLIIAFILSTIFGEIEMEEYIN